MAIKPIITGIRTNRFAGKKSSAAGPWIPGTYKVQYHLLSKLEFRLVGQYLKDTRRFSRLTDKEVTDNAVGARQGDLGKRNDLVTGNLAIVIDYVKKFQGLGLSYNDLLQEGNIGLIRAASTFDPFRPVDNGDLSKGFVRFSTWAVRCIRQDISQALIDKAHMIRIPRSTYMKLRAFKSAVKELEKQLGTIPNAREAAEAAGISPEEAEKMAVLLKLEATVSLEKLVVDHDSLRLLDVIKDRSVKMPNAGIKETLLRKKIANLLHVLDERERKVIHLRFGFGGIEPLTLEEVGKLLGGRTRERVRQIEEGAIDKLRKFDVFTYFPRSSKHDIFRLFGA
jgi:RNA polymerase primary sigma factor